MTLSELSTGRPAARSPEGWRIGLATGAMRYTPPACSLVANARRRPSHQYKGTLRPSSVSAWDGEVSGSFRGGPPP
jgi:hypothetical protein